MIQVNVPLDKSIEALTEFVNKVGNTDKRKLKKVLWFVDELLAKIGLFIFILVLSFVFLAIINFVLK